MRKALFLLNINDYEPEITALTMPLFKRWAARIRAEIVEMKFRYYPDMPMVYEKFQIYNLAQLYHADWNIYMDMDTLVHPNFFDFVEYVPKNVVMSYRKEPVTTKFIMDDYFRRDGRFIGVGGFFVAASNQCLDLWHPLDDLTKEEVLDRIIPLAQETEAGVPRTHLFEEFILSRNIARYGLRYKMISELQTEVGLPNINHCWHIPTVPSAVKLEKMRGIVDAWGV